MSDVQTDKKNPLDQQGAADAILAKWTDAEETQPSEDVVPEAEDQAALTEETESSDDLIDEAEVDIDDEDDNDQSTEDDDTDLDDEDDEIEQTVDEEEALEALEIDDDHEVEIKVNGEVKTASIASLKRLYGQEASITRKSQELASQRRYAEEAVGKSTAVLKRMLDQATEKFKPYAEIDMLVASKTMSDEEFAALRKEATAAAQNLKFLQEETDTFYSAMREQQQAALQEQAKVAVKQLEAEVDGWSNELYNDIRSYAIEQGMSEDVVNTIVDPVAIKFINKARMFDQGKKVATVKKKSAASRKTLRSKKAPASEAQTKKRNLSKQKNALRANQRQDLTDAASVIMARWEHVNHLAMKRI